MANWQDTSTRVSKIAGENADGIEILKFDTLDTGVHSVQSKVCYKVQNMWLFLADENISKASFTAKIDQFFCAFFFQKTQEQNQKDK